MASNIVTSRAPGTFFPPSEMSGMDTTQTITSPSALSPDCTLADWLNYWIETYGPIRANSGKTLERYRQLAGYVIAPRTPELARASQCAIASLSVKILEPAFLSMLTAPAIRRRHLSARSIRHLASLVNVALDKAFRLELVPANAMDKVELPSFSRKRIRALTPEEIGVLRQVCRGDWTFPLVELALATGCRRGEMLALEWTDINWTVGTLSISKSLEETAAGLRIKGTKSDKPRLCRLPHAAIDALTDLRRVNPDGRLVFPKENGNYRRPALVSQTIVRRLRRAKIHDASMHTLRHTHASNLLSKGVPLPAVSERLGHADPNITARIYSHALPADDSRAAEVWDSIISAVP